MSTEYFRKVYDEDPTNAAKQSFENFIAYATGQEGMAATAWKEEADKLKEGLQPEGLTRIESRLEQLGKRAIGEWAKDNNIRAFDDKPLRKWLKLLKEARTQDAGDGKQLEAALNTAETELADFIKNRGLPLI